MKTFPRLVCPDPAPGANTQPIPLSLCVFLSHIPLAAYISFLLVIARFVSFVKHYLHISEDRGRKKKFWCFFFLILLFMLDLWEFGEGRQTGWHTESGVSVCVCLRLCVFISVWLVCDFLYVLWGSFDCVHVLLSLCLCTLHYLCVSYALFVCVCVYVCVSVQTPAVL